MKHLLAVLAVALVSQHAVAETKSFADLGCSVSLPDESWQWENVPNVTAAMSSEAGVVLTLAVKPAPAGFKIDDKFITSFEKGSVVPGAIKKRGGAMTTFKGVPCYQLNTTMLEDGSTATTFAFAAQGNFYLLQLLGGEEPVELAPDLQKILNSFQFTNQNPSPSQTEASSSTDFSQIMGMLVGLCVIGIIVVLLVKKKGTKKS